MNLKDVGLNNPALDLIIKEDINQREKWGEQEHSIEEWFVILSEEVGEMAKAITEKSYISLVDEAIQVSTLALKIAYMMERKTIGEIRRDV